MTGCTLRAFGADFDIDAFLNRSPLAAAVVLRRGLPLRPGARFVARASGLAVAVSAAPTRAEQERDALRFVDGFADELDALTAWPGVERAWLDFALPCRLGPEVAVQAEPFSAGLVAALARHRLGLEVSICERPALDPRALLRAAVDRQPRRPG
jgi:hypothetical protein